MKNAVSIVLAILSSLSISTAQAQKGDTVDMHEFSGHYIQQEPARHHSPISIQFAIPFSDPIDSTSQDSPWLTYSSAKTMGRCEFDKFWVTRDSISFTTFQSEHQLFEFSGHWLVGRDQFITSSGSPIVLEGYLRWFVSGKVKWRGVVKFTFAEGC